MGRQKHDQRRKKLEARRRTAADREVHDAALRRARKAAYDYDTAWRRGVSSGEK